MVYQYSGSFLTVVQNFRRHYLVNRYFDQVFAHKSITDFKIRNWLFWTIEAYWQLEKRIENEFAIPDNIAKSSIETTSQENPSCRYQVIIFRLQTGHCQLRAHLYKIVQVDSPRCTRCRSEKTAQQLILFRVRFQPERQHMIDADMPYVITKFDLLCRMY